jgi:replicative DNA helicase
MAAVAFDPLGYTHDLEATGVPREQAEVHAKAMTAMFLHNFDALVTTDYLDTRFTEFETRIEANMDQRFTAMEASMDKRFNAMETSVVQRFTSVDQRFTAMEINVDKQFAEVDKRFDGLELRFERIDSKFSRIYLMFGLTMVTATIPILQNYFGQ